MKNWYILVLLTIILVACNDNRAVGNLSAAGGDHIDVELWVSSTNNTDLRLFFTEDKDEVFTAEKSLVKRIAGSSTLKKVVFELPTAIRRPQLRLDFDNTTQAVFKRLILRYGDRSIDAYGTEVFRYFRPDITTCSIDVETGVIEPVEKHGKLLTASLYPHKVFMDHQLKLLTK